MCADIDARYPGLETCSTATGTGTFTCKGVSISNKRPSVNFRIYWDGDLQDELLDGTVITKWTGSGTNTLFSPSGVSSCNSTKKTPNLTADLFGDWREELILWTTADSGQLRVYTTTAASPYRLFTLMHDPVYRLAVAWQNAAYNQPPHLGFYIGGGLNGIRQPAISTVKYGTETGLDKAVKAVANVYTASGRLFVVAAETITSVTVYSISGQALFKAGAINHTEYDAAIPQGVNLMLVKITTASGTCVKKVAV